MQTAPAPNPSPERADPKGQPADGAPSRSAGLIALVRKLIDIGKALIATALAPSDEDARTTLPLRFGTFNIALIIARITRGLRLAEALEARLIRNARRLDHPPARAAKADADAAEKPTRARRPVAPALSQEADDAALLARMPSAKAIAARVRRTPIGVILDDICRDLGIDCTHPLWEEIRTAIIGNNGSLVRHLNGIFERQRPMQATLPTTSALPRASAFPIPSLAMGTGPP